MSLTRKYGWLPDLPDPRDWMLAAPGGRELKKLPTKADLRPGCSPVENQGALGSCTANALAGALEYLERQADPEGLYQDLSRLFIYYNERVARHTVESDGGAMLRDGIKVLAKQGVCHESRWPYDIARFKVKPTPPCYAEAKKHQILEYRRLENLDAMRASLAAGYPFVFGFMVFPQMQTPEMARTGKLRLPKANERPLGGHAVCAVGYDDRRGVLIVRNSWGAAWGMKGYFTMPYGYIESGNLTADHWAIYKAEM
jgi:C1A family cysteine protease